MWIKYYNIKLKEFIVILLILLFIIKNIKYKLYISKLQTRLWVLA